MPDVMAAGWQDDERGRYGRDGSNDEHGRDKAPVIRALGEQRELVEGTIGYRVDPKQHDRR
ncbi:hypothetical protein RJ035_001425 [Blastomyces gilchristii]